MTGELISARDAYAGFTAAIAAAREGEAGEALREGGLATLATLGAIPLIGYLPRLGRGALKAFRASRQLLKQGKQNRHVPEPHSVQSPTSDNKRWIDVEGLDPLDPESISIPMSSGRLVLDQGQEPSCGVHCGAMVLDTLGRAYEIDQIKKLVGYTDEIGTRVPELNNALRQLGVKDARLVWNPSMKQMARRINKDHPAIAMVDLTMPNPDDIGLHGVVVDGIEFLPSHPWDGLVYIRDPAGGREYASPLRDFFSKFAGNVIITKPRR